MTEERKEKLLLTGVVLLVLVIGFLAGRLSVKLDALSRDEPVQEVGQISETVPTIHFTSFQQGLLYGSHNEQEVRILVGGKMVENKPDGSFFIDTGSIKEVPLASNENGNNSVMYLFVASKNGKVFHPIGSSAANSIKAENKLYFESREEAEKAGLSAGSDVK